ncbi:hypothetical protein BGZ65_011178 [Modicella reniformis]|uniref:Uncharacterized protein n=1 Tax=Modicella reniformis TaxID=1440133 RepID=A0A9P6MKB7_9FUNG|nr:hypothetical protein BGZ65_011178 [Modicella reniformis]
MSSSHDPDSLFAPAAAAAAPTATTEPLAIIPSTPLSLFFLPTDLISSLVPKDQAEAAAAAAVDPVVDDSISTSTNSTATLASETAAVTTSPDTAVPSCRVCRITQFDSVLKQQSWTGINTTSSSSC